MYESIEELTKFNQQHLVQFWDELDESSQASLRKQIEEINFEQLGELVKKIDGDHRWAELASKAKPPNAIRLGQNEPFTREEAIARGERALREGKVGLLLVAGGQGTRLGFDAPKGMYPLGPVSNRTLFEIHIDKAIALGAYYGVELPLFIMTSPATHEETVNFLATNGHFGVKQDQIKIFCQGTMPAVCIESGKVLLEEKDRIFTAPNGHGGTVAALEQHGCLDLLDQRGVENVFYWQVDNPMVQVCDPLTIGYHILCESELTSHACPKREATHKVGNLVEIDGKIQIIEYSDLPDEVAGQTNPDGSLKLWAGNIAVHIFDVNFLQKMVHHADALPFHLAQKKVAFLDSDGNRVVPDQPNAIKFEKFIFDLMPMAKNALIVEVDPRDAFSPLKNAAGAPSDTAESAQAAMMDQARRWLREADIAVDDSIAVEINPRFALNSRQLKDKMDLESVNESSYFI